MKTLKKIALILSLYLAIPYTECGNIWKQISSLAQQSASVANFTQIWQSLTPYANNTVSIPGPVQQNILNTYNTSAATVATMTQDQIDALNRINVMINGGSMPLRAGVAGPLPAPQPSLWNPAGAPPAGADAPAGAVAAPGLFRSSATGSALNTANEFLQAVHDLGNKPLYNRLFGPDAEFYTQRAFEQTMEGAGSTTSLPLLQQCITKLAPAATTIDIRNDCLQRLNGSLRALQNVLLNQLIPDITKDLLATRDLINKLRVTYIPANQTFSKSPLAPYIERMNVANAQNPGISTVDFFNQTMSNLMRSLVHHTAMPDYEYIAGTTINIPELYPSLPVLNFVPIMPDNDSDSAALRNILNPDSPINTFGSVYSTASAFVHNLMIESYVTNALLSQAATNAYFRIPPRTSLSQKTKAVTDRVLVKTEIDALKAAYDQLLISVEQKSDIILALAFNVKLQEITGLADMDTLLRAIGFDPNRHMTTTFIESGIFAIAFGPNGLGTRYEPKAPYNQSSLPLDNTMKKTTAEIKLAISIKAKCYFYEFLLKELQDLYNFSQILIKLGMTRINVPKLKICSSAGCSPTVPVDLANYSNMIASATIFNASITFE